MEFEKSNPNPWSTANFASRYFFWWLMPLFLKGVKGNLKLNDIYDCPYVDSSEKQGTDLQQKWDRELEKLKSGKKPSLVRATVRTFGVAYCLNALLVVVEECFTVLLQAILLSHLMLHFQRSKILPRPYLYLTTAGFCLLSALNAFTHNLFYFESRRIGMRIRIACCSLIYKKALRLSQTALGKTTVGQMVNLLSNDVSKFDQILHMPYMIVAPLHSAIAIYILWMRIGYASIAAFSVLMLFIPFQSLMGKMFSKLRLKVAGLTDERIRLMNDIIGGMRVIKMYGWEIPFAMLVDLSRRREVRKIRQTFILHGINLSVFFSSSKVILLIAFVVYLLGVKGDLTPEKVFVCMALFNTINHNMAFRIPQGVTQAAEALISLKRIQKFLLLEEESETCLIDVSNSRPKLSECGIWMEKVVASWSKEDGATLRNVSLTVKPGELLAVVGSVGCGKTSLLMALLGELPVTSGDVKIRGRVAYASQEPWVFSGSIRQNILFGSNFDEERYREVLRVCALNKDINVFPFGDQTTVGERGVILSGGQKARVNLARAMYFDADIFLLDDPLSAVDASVSKHLFEKCINGYLKDKVRILATHQIQFLKQASQILVLKDGAFLALGTYENLVNAGVDLGSLVDNKQKRLGKVVATANSTSIVEDISDVIPMCESTLFNTSVDGDCDEVGSSCNISDKAPKQDDESKSSGSVSLRVYNEYIKSGAGAFLRLIIVGLFIASQALANGSDFWLATWTNAELLKYSIKDCWAGANKTFLNETGFYASSFDREFFREMIGNVSDDCFVSTRNYTEDVYDADRNVKIRHSLPVYAWMVLTIFLLTFLKTTTFFEMCLRASVSLHNKMFKSVLRSPVAFFDRNPIGRILTRFSKDTGVIDDPLPMSALDSFQYFGIGIGVVILVSIVEPYLLLPIAFMCVIVVVLLKFYLPTMRDVKRYEGITRSPVFSHLSTSLYGLTTIRAFKVQRPHEIYFEHYQDQNTATCFISNSVTLWLATALEWLTVVYISSVTVTMVILSEDPSYASKAGLAIASVLQLSGVFHWALCQSAEVESQMTSVERVLQYSNLQSEAALESDQDGKPPSHWPSKGYIVYQNVSLVYNPDEPPVLKNLSFEINPEEKVGIVGRTGAGKSSIIASLFRMNEPDGEIKIDGFCTRNIGLHDLRKKISIIPQDPVLFAGPVRRNLDPFSEHCDNELWQALDEVYLKDSIAELSNGLDAKVCEGGSNFSVGQRQLICLARAILRRNKILVLDEATANVDINTDSLIQRTIRDRFADCTVLTIAHRLYTIMDSDRVMVLDAGEVKEFEEPYSLLQNPSSIFSQMVQKTGPRMAKQLCKVAFSAHIRNSAKKSGVTNEFEGPDENGAIEMDCSNSIARNVANSDRHSVSEIYENEAYMHTELTYL